MKILNIIVAAMIISTSCSESESSSITKWVDTSIGTGGHGHVFKGASAPFGLVQVGPTSVPEAWDWTSGYHASDSTVIGFSHTHLSGTGIGDLFDITVMPVVGDVKYSRGNTQDSLSGMWSYADRTQEVSTPAYYSVPLTRYNILCEMTATPRVGFHRYTFPQSTESAIVFDLENGGCWDNPTETFMEANGDYQIVGYRYSTGWAKDQRVWFVAEFSEPFTSFEIIDDKNRYARVSFPTQEDHQILMKVALSPVSIDGAKANMTIEADGWDFEQTVKQTELAWHNELSKIRIDSSSERDKRIFYTSLYHTMVSPSIFCDADGDYRGADGEFYYDADFTNYTTFSLWDTYRAAMPLMTLIHPEKISDIINTMITISEQQGRLPVWHLWGNETDCMVGNPGMSVVADAIVKDTEGVDKERAFAQILKTAKSGDRGGDIRERYGYIPCDLYGEAVANDMEYAIADGAAAIAAKSLGKMEEYSYFDHRSHSYRIYFDKKSQFIRGVDSKGEFRTPFNPYHSTHRADDYCEGNAWQYTWLAPHDIDGLEECFGGRQSMLNKLDSLFIVSSEIEGEVTSPDISGLIGQYAHGNEPSHHIAYLYTMLGEPWKSADRVREILSTLYTDKCDGISGNEDAGQMSAWYILSAMGFYQVHPSDGKFYFGSPLFNSIEMDVKEGVFSIIAHNNSKENRYIESVKLNGKLYTKPYICYKDIVKGGTIEFEMSSKPKVWYSPDEPIEYISQRPAEDDRLFVSEAIECEIKRISEMLENDRLRWMFNNCFPNTLDTTVHYNEQANGVPDTYVYTGDIAAMWLRDSAAQVWPYIQYANDDIKLKQMIEGVIRRQFKLINIDPYANAFNNGPTGVKHPEDYLPQSPWVFERKWEIDSHCYPIRLAYQYWKESGDTTIFDDEWVKAIESILKTLKAQQCKQGHSGYIFLRNTDRQLDTKCCVGRGNPVNPVGLIASAFRPSDDATTFEFLVPANFMAVSSLRKAAEILQSVNSEHEIAAQCTALSQEVEDALARYAIVEHPKYGEIYAYEVDGFGNAYMMDDANVPSLLAMSYLGDIDRDDPIYQNTRKFVLSTDNPYFWQGVSGEGVGSPHIGVEMIWPMSIMMRAFTSTNDEEIRQCIALLMTTDAGTGFMHESFSRHNASNYTREWFAWQNTLFGELILKLINDGKLDLLNSII
ncbi:MAG: GH92 family glycosyl hydrolase [Rikenellaceae bacterium]